MQNGQNIIPMGKNRFPGAVAFVENFDTNDDAEPADILSFESLREAFATNNFAEIEQEMLEIPEPKTSECPDYDIDDAIDLKYDDSDPSSQTGLPMTVNARLETIIEAMLFVGNRENRPLAAEQIAEKLRNVSAVEVDQAVTYLNGHYQERGYPYHIIFERGGYRMTLRSEYESVLANFSGKVREARLTQQAIDTLAIVAYRQPITAEEIQTIRKQSCSNILNQLVRRDLLRISREVQDKKSVARYHTTSRFLELFQIKSLDDIPREDEWTAAQ